jgi:hypothetical protein
MDSVLLVAVPSLELIQPSCKPLWHRKVLERGQFQPELGGGGAQSISSDGKSLHFCSLMPSRKGYFESRPSNKCALLTVRTNRILIEARPFFLLLGLWRLRNQRAYDCNCPKTIAGIFGTRLFHCRLNNGNFAGLLLLTWEKDNGAFF